MDEGTYDDLESFTTGNDSAFGALFQAKPYHTRRDHGRGMAKPKKRSS